MMDSYFDTFELDGVRHALSSLKFDLRLLAATAFAVRLYFGSLWILEST